MKEFRIKVKGIIKYEDKYLILKKWYDDNITSPYRWEFVDDSVEFGSSPETTVQTAVKEKTGMDVQIDRILYTWSYVVGEVQYLGLAYLCDALDDLVMLSEDILEYAWVEPDKFSEYIDNDMLLADVSGNISKE